MKHAPSIPSLIRNFFTTPTFDDEDKAFVARLLYIILRALFVLSLLFAIPFSVFAPEMWWRYTIIAGVRAHRANVQTQSTRDAGFIVERDIRIQMNRIDRAGAYAHIAARKFIVCVHTTTGVE